MELCSYLPRCHLHSDLKAITWNYQTAFLWLTGTGTPVTWDTYSAKIFMTFVSYGACHCRPGPSLGWSNWALQAHSWRHFTGWRHTLCHCESNWDWVSMLAICQGGLVTVMSFPSCFVFICSLAFLQDGISGQHPVFPIWLQRQYVYLCSWCWLHRRGKACDSGDELIFSNNTQWEERQAPLFSDVLAEESQPPATCPVGSADTEPPSCSFNVPLSEHYLKELSHKNFAPETMRKVRWATKIYCDWRVYRHSLGLERIECDLDEWSSITATSLKSALCCFITEVKKVDGTEFPGKTLYDIVICIQFHLECLGFSFKLINDGIFRDIKFMLDNTMKLWVASGMRLSVRQAQVL